MRKLAERIQTSNVALTEPMIKVLKCAKVIKKSHFNRLIVEFIANHV